jgi:hypothetical protein
MVTTEQHPCTELQPFTSNVSWNCEVNNTVNSTLQASTSKQLNHSSVILISADDTASLNKSQHTETVKYCTENYSLQDTGRAAGCHLPPYWSKHHFVTAWLTISHLQGTQDHLLHCIINSQFCTPSVIIFKTSLIHNIINIKMHRVHIIHTTYQYVSASHSLYIHSKIFFSEYSLSFWVHILSCCLHIFQVWLLMAVTWTSTCKATDFASDFVLQNDLQVPSLLPSVTLVMRSSL